MKRKKVVYWIDELCKEDNEIVGKKCANLGELASIGVRVPRGFAVSVHGWERFVELTGIAGEMRRLFEKEGGDLHVPSKGQRLSNAMRALIESQQVPAEISDVVLGSYERLCEEASMHDMPVAVRSAGAVSMPGAMESYLNVSGQADVVTKLLRVWSSAYTYRAVVYRHDHNLAVDYAPIGVAVLQLVDAKAAGVLMTANPTSGNTAEAVIESNWGLGESVVSGVTNPDRFNVSKDDLIITSKVVNTKAKQVVPSAGGAACVDVPAELRDAPSLTDEEVRLLAREAMRIERHFGEPTDIEWAYASGQSPEQSLYFLQARPMKPLPKYKDAIDRVLDMMLN
ncbi:MAG: PEP/pyruvate-binding domain-containing protein [Syntrophorhabdales bacterium]|jgi:pyruvate,water dikinase